MEQFLLGTHQPNWLAKTDVPLFVSVRRFMKMNRLPRARGPWCLDSGGFQELFLHGEWTITVRQYVAEVRRYVECVGNLRWAACQDHMVEPQILAKTGKTVAEHQIRTVLNYVELLNAAPELPWAPVIQGWSWGEYLDHVEMYQKAGVDLRKAPIVGVGTMCRRSATTRANAILATLAADNIRTHAFGYKLRGLALAKEYVASADSLAWSFNARRHPPLPECEGRHEHCNNCLRWALRWRAKVMRLLGVTEEPREEPPVERTLF